MSAIEAGCRLIDRLAATDDDLLRLLVQEATFGIAIIDSSAHIVRVNAALRRMAAVSCSLDAGSTLLDVFAPSRRTEAWHELRLVLTGARPQITFVSMILGKDGVFEQTVDVSVVALREADDSLSGAILHLSDISVQARLEAQLAHGQKLQAVGQFTSAVAHDFNNLLMAISGAADEVLLRGALDAESEADLHQIRTSSERGANLVRHLLAFGKPQSQKSRALAVNDVVIALSRLLRRLVGSSVKLELVVASNNPSVWADPVALDQMLVNLVVNARNAMPDGGVVTLRTDEMVVVDAIEWQGALVCPGRYVLIAVEDSGFGIAPDVLPRIFDPFFTTRGEQGGSGLGLSNVNAIVHRCHGFVTVTSEVGRGTQFCIYLPYHDRVAESAAAVAKDVGPTGIDNRLGQAAVHRKIVLLVEDDEGLRLLSARALDAKGWAVIAMDSGESAIAMLAADSSLVEDLRLVVADLSLPGMDGLALVRSVRRARPDVPAILVSGYPQEAGEGFSGENTLYFTKPYTLAILSEAVQRHALSS